MKSRRNQFYIFKGLIVFISKLYAILPNFILQFLWDLSRPYSQLPFILLRYVILKSRISSCGDNIRIGTNVTIKGWKHLEIGSDVSIHDNCYIDAGGFISLGNNVSIAHNSTLLSGTHTYEDKNVPIKYNKITIKDGLKVCDDVWIGCGVRVLSDLIISKRVIVAAGAVVNKSLDGNSIYAGVPAEKIKEI
ncbi:acyltransferase [uncultured Winogradskyella sp.]|uniref:acyltransferase n=1 Tax=uncultured Winogradskyella sp. TaxID=395353 RepID=UPI00263748E3|nr:acyltransferase [uncultured Winogradskyella sp.]